VEGVNNVIQTGLLVEGRISTRDYWHDVYEKHGPAILAYLINRTGKKQDAEDLLQETFVRAIKASGSLREEGKLKSYLFSVAHNLMVNSFRKRREESLPVNEDTNMDPFESIPDNLRLAPDEEAMGSELNQRVHSTLETMSEKYKIAFQLGVLEGLTYNEIARNTGWSLPQVKINIHRARKQMINELSTFGFLD